MADMKDLPPYYRQSGNEGYQTPTLIEGTLRSVPLSFDGYPFPIQTLTDRHISNEANEISSEGKLSKLGLRDQGRLPWKQRIRHFTWAYFTLTMATGGIANAIAQIPGPYRFPGLQIIGLVTCLINILFYIAIWALLILRFCLYPFTFRASFLHPTESLFVPAAVVSFGTILINITQYTGSRILDPLRILFWFDAALAVISSAGIYLLLWSTQTFTIAEMTPIWIFPAYPMLIVGPHAGLLSAELTPPRSLSVIIGGFTIQGVGFLVSLAVYSAYIYRLMTQKLPKGNARPGMFVSIGPSAFTVSALTSLAANAKQSFQPGFMGDGELAATIVQVVANFACLWLWGLAIFFLIIAIFAHMSVIGHGRISFTMAWFSFVFPNTALTSATFAIGKAFACDSIIIIGLSMIVLLVLMYGFVCFMMIRAIRLHHILWPQKGEDKDEGGFRIKEHKPESPGERSPA